jgi:hypothetical protein
MLSSRGNYFIGVYLKYSLHWEKLKKKSFQPQSSLKLVQSHQSVLVLVLVL